MIKIYADEILPQTSMISVPPVQTPMTIYGTQTKVFQKSNKLAMQAYKIIGVGVAMQAYHLIWNKPEKWKRVIIHLGNFHSFMAFFGVIEKFSAGGFEDIVYQSNPRTSSSCKYSNIREALQSMLQGPREYLRSYREVIYINFSS